MTQMKLSSISGITCHVADLRRSAEFYQALGFRRGNETPDRLTCYVNWFWMTLIAQDHEGSRAPQSASELPSKGGGLAIHIKVDDIDEAYRGAVAAGMKPGGEPQKSPSGSREFTLRDPDGYQLVFFQKK